MTNKDELGLSQAEAARRLQQFGPNELPAGKSRTLLAIALSVLKEPMFLLLVGAASLYLLIGDLGEGLLLAAFAALSILLVVVQESRTERAVEALKAMQAPEARAYRDGSLSAIPARELVPGDVVAITEGDRAPADGVLIQAQDMACDESLLTGESLPVAKRVASVLGTAGPVAGEDGGADRLMMGALITSGHGLAEITATGVKTRTGALGQSLATIVSGPTPLQRSIRGLVQIFGGLAIAISLSIVLITGLGGGGWIKGLLAGMAAAMSLVPEEFPMALMILLAFGARRLASAHVLVRRPEMVETLGAASVLCVDKTGTLTENRMRVAALLADGARFEAASAVRSTSAFGELLKAARLASRPHAIDPMDRAIHDFLRTEAVFAEPTDLELAREYPVAADRAMFAALWRAPDGALTLAAKGAPEAILACCDLGEDARRGALAEAAGFAAGGVRVLGVAIAATEQPPADPRDATFRFLGFVGFVDPLRESAKDAVAEAHAAGIVVIMLTGDHPVTAAAIAGAAGLDGAASAMTGAALAALDEDALDAALRTCRVFARIAPEQKLRIVRALRRQGHVVAMTGDGVNDAPALKAAHIGIAMGRGGTDVAREAAGIVVLDDNFAAIVSGVRIGRRIFDNLRKVATYITAIHVPLGGLAIAPLLLGLPPMLAPAHIVLMEMAIDPTCSIAFESAQPDKDLMKRPPRALDEPILTPARLGKGLAQGGILLAACLALYAGLFSAGAGEETARAVAFLALTLGNVGLMLSNITNAPAWRLVGARGTQTVWLIAGAAVSVAVAGIYWPPAAQLLGFKSLSLLHFGLAWLTAAAAFALFEAFKLATGGILIQRNGRLKFPWEQEH